MIALGVLGSSFLSALFPLINIEAILAVAAHNDPLAALWLAAVAAVGQMAGKVIWYLAGANTERFAWVHRRMERPRAKAAMAKWHARAVGRPWYTAGLLFFSALVGFPPYAVIAVLAGVIRAPFWVFLVSGFVGRFLRFWLVVGTTLAILPGS